VKTHFMASRLFRATGGTMRMAIRGTATATALALTWAAAVGCSSAGQPVGAKTAADTAPAATAEQAPAAAAEALSAPAASARITQAAFNEDSDGARIVLSANAPLLYTSYEPRPDLLILDLRDASVAEGFAAPKTEGGLVESIKFEELDELGRRITRVSIAHSAESRPDVRSVGQGLAVAFSGPAVVAQSGQAEAETAPLAAAPASVEPAATDVAAAPEPKPAGTAPVTAAAARGEMAHALENVVAESRDGHVAITLTGDGWFTPKDFVLSNPPRIVLDLPGVKNEVRQRSIAVSGDMVSRIRVSQFQTSPFRHLGRRGPAADASRDRADGERARRRRNTSGVSGLHRARAGQTDGIGTPATTMLATASSEASAVETAGAPVPDVEPAAAHTPAAEPAVADASVPAPAPAAVAEPIAATTVVEPPVEVAESHPAPPPPAAPPKPAVAEASVKAPAPPAPAAPKPAPRPAASRGDALFEAAAAVLDQEQASRPDAGSSYRSRTISEAQTQFTGEPISLDLKDADIKDVFRTVSQLTGLNIVIDPDVRGTVTVQLEDVPWDQALDLILKQNSLGYVLENNIMRIATTSKLQAEEGDRARLAEARQAAEPTRTVIKKLSYAKATEIVPTLQSVMSKRGAIVVDQRTNTLIIREIPTYLPAVLQLIDNLDTATPQVVIESRIVETTKSLGRSLGINWSVRGKADNASGNTTNLIFPNTVLGGLDVGLGNGPTVASLVLGNILNTFNLDVALTAAENQGLLKIISSPKVTSLTNTPALIQSGVQIPVQTTVNNTTTVIYVDATLKLDVTPQITAEGTILLTVNVTKREPAVALNLSLGQNVPLTIREYRGQVLVKDGGTTVIGGIFQINDQDQNNMIPGLWKIPVLGNLFRNKTRTEKHDELLIFITPRILRS
jgi:type IV pilus assembly protein PilQ